VSVLAAGLGLAVVASCSDNTLPTQTSSPNAAVAVLPDQALAVDQTSGALTGTTWGCGYVAPTPRMQYSASSFADFLVSQFRFGLWTERHGGRVRGLFPGHGEFASHTPDLVLDRILLPAFHRLALACSWLRARVQNGLIPTYLLYVALTLLLLLVLVAR
jgi:hydrogenase-4 component B